MACCLPAVVSLHYRVLAVQRSAFELVVTMSNDCCNAMLRLHNLSGDTLEPMDPALFLSRISFTTHLLT